jgi:hypothetical protein
MNLDGDIILDPMDADEQDNLVFHFERVVTAGVSISSAVVGVGVHSGTDADPAQVLDGTHQVQGLTVVQRVKAHLPADDVTYWVRCTATLSDGRKITIWGRLRIMLMR